MTGPSGNLTLDDVQRLLSDPSGGNRAITAIKIAATFAEGHLDPEGRALAEDIFRLMAKDVEVKVRVALAASLHASPDLPHDVALSLAQDVESVALPVLEYSKVLNDGDLIQILQYAGTQKQNAVANRKQISARLSSAIIAHAASEDVIVTLAGNKGADINVESLERALEKFPGSQKIADKMVERERLPMGIASRLVDLVSQHLKSALLQRHPLTSKAASDLLLEARDKALMEMIPTGQDITHLMDMVEDMEASGQLTPTLILRSLCMGDVSFFEAAMAGLARIPLANAQTLIHDQGELGLKSLYHHANMPDTLFPAIRVALDMIKETERDGEVYNMPRYRQKMIERILTKYNDLGEETVSYLIDKLNRLAA